MATKYTLEPKGQAACKGEEDNQSIVSTLSEAVIEEVSTDEGRN
jgi:hypothetical protein